MIRTLSLAFLLTATVSVAIAPGAIAQTGERRFDVGRFDAVELASSDHVLVVVGDRASVTADGDPRAVAALEVEVRGSSLRIGRRPGNWRDRGAIVTVTTPVLRGTAISGSGDIRVARIVGPDFSGGVSGSGRLIVADMKVRGASFSMNGSGSISAVGEAGNAAIKLGGSGRVDTSRLAASDATIALGGSGSVAARASRTATVSLGGSGSVRVTGGARCTISRSGSGSVRCD